MENQAVLRTDVQLAELEGDAREGAGLVERRRRDAGLSTLGLGHGLHQLTGRTAEREAAVGTLDTAQRAGDLERRLALGVALLEDFVHAFGALEHRSAKAARERVATDLNTEERVVALIAAARTGLSVGRGILSECRSGHQTERECSQSCQFLHHLHDVSPVDTIERNTRRNTDISASRT